MGEGGGGEEKAPSALSLFRFHLSPFPQKRLILRLLGTRKVCLSHAGGLRCQTYLWPFTVGKGGLAQSVSRAFMFEMRWNPRETVRNPFQTVLNRPIRLTQCCTQFKSPGVMILCVLYLHYNVAFTFKWYGNFWNKTFYSQRVWIGYNIELAEQVSGATARRPRIVDDLGPWELKSTKSKMARGRQGRRHGWFSLVFHLFCKVSSGYRWIKQ